MIQNDGPDRNFRHRNEHKAHYDEPEAKKYNRDELHWWIDHLFDLMEETDPETCPDAASKDRKAVMALQGMSIISKFLTGWAMDHVIGLAMIGRTPFPNMPDNLEWTDEQQEEFASANNHEHEKRASLHFRNHTSDSGLGKENQRLLVWMLLRCNTPSLPYALRMELSEALEATKYGETKPFFIVEAGGYGDTGYSQKCLQMKALEHVAFRHGAGRTKEAARDVVADCYDVDPDRMRKWKKPLQKFFGDLEVNRRLGVAANGGRAMKESEKKQGQQGERDRFEVAPQANHFSDDILAVTGKQFQAIDTRKRLPPV